MSAYELTRGEREVVRQVIAGAPPTYLRSASTVQDHLKSISATVGVRAAASSSRA